MSPLDSTGADSRANTVDEDLIIVWPGMQVPFRLDPTVPSFLPTSRGEFGTAEEKEEKLLKSLLEDINAVLRDPGRGDPYPGPPGEGFLHGSFAGFFGDDEIVHVHGMRWELDVIKNEIETNGQAMWRGPFAQDALDLQLHYGVTPCDCAIGLTEQGRGWPTGAKATMPLPPSAPGDRESRTPEVLTGRKLSFVDDKDALLPSLGLAPPLIHPLAGKSRPQQVTAPMEKPKNVSHAKWNNVPLFEGLTDDESLGGWVHPDDLQGGIALKLAHSHKNSEIADKITALYKSAGLAPPTRSALTYRWTHALEARCKQDGKNFKIEKKRISNLRPDKRIRGYWFHSSSPGRSNTGFVVRVDTR